MSLEKVLKSKLTPIDEALLSKLKCGDGIARYGLFSNLTFVGRENGHVTIRDNSGNEKRIFESLFLKHGFIEASTIQPNQTTMTTPISTAASAVAEQEHVNAIFGSEPLGSFTQAMLDSATADLRKQLDEAKERDGNVISHLQMQLTQAKAETEIKAAALAGVSETLEKVKGERDTALARPAQVERERDSWIAAARVDSVSAKLVADHLRAQVAKLEAEAGAMRAALQQAAPFDGLNPASDICPHCIQHKTKHLQDCAWVSARNALATDAGASLLARLQAAEADTKRLDWLENTQFAMSHDDAECFLTRGRPFYRKTVRLAIDAAMSPQPEEGKP